MQFSCIYMINYGLMGYSCDNGCYACGVTIPHYRNFSSNHNIYISTVML